MADLASILDTAGGVLEQMLDTGGTTLTITRPGRVQAADPATAAAAAPAEETIAEDVAGFVVLDTTGSTQPSLPGTLPAQDPVWRVVVGPEVVDVQRGDRVTVTDSRDARLIGRVFEITLLVDGFAGVARQILAKAVGTPV